MKTVDQGIILQRRTYSETSLIVKAYTRSGGLQSFIFKGGKKKAHGIFPCSLSELEFYDRNESDLLHLTSVSNYESLDFPFDPVRGTIAFFIAEVIQKCVHPNEPDKPLYAFVENAIKELNSLENVRHFPVGFLFQLSNHLGVQPQVIHPEGMYFSLEDGLIDQHGHRAIHAETGEGVRLIRSLAQHHEISASREAREHALQILLRYLQFHIPGFTHPDSYDIVREVLHD